MRETVREGLRATGFNEVTLLSLNAGEYGGVERLVSQVANDGASQQVGVAMPSRYSSQASVDDARALAENLGIGFRLVSIDPMFQAVSDAL